MKEEKKVDILFWRTGNLMAGGEIVDCCSV